MTVKSGVRLGPGIVVLLVIITLANVFALAVGVMSWRYEATHGGDLQGFLAIGTLLTVVALVGVAGAWARREWGATLYLGAQATGLALTLFAMPAALGPLSLVPLLLAGLLWLCTR
jgi:hypothetical protein